MAALAQVFGYILNAIYSFVNNYGVSIIIFSIIFKIILIPLAIKQQKTMKKSQKMQGKLQEIQFKYKNDPEKLNTETLRLYKEENMSPFSGCLSSIIQIVVLLAVFTMVRSPLTYMKNIENNHPGLLDQYANELKETGQLSNEAYKEIDIIKVKGPEDDRVNINMDFLGIDLSKVPTASLNDPKVYIIPVLYVLTSFISIRMTTNMQKNKNNKLLADDNEKSSNKGVDNEIEVDAMEQANKTMSWFMPIMSISIAVFTPLGLALYWLMSNILMIIERLIINKFLDSKEE